MNDAQSAGDAAPLELRIDAKSFLSADGTPVEVVRGLELRLEAGSFGALIGPSGCGKTTILKIAAGLDPDFRGELRTPGSGHLGMVFQEPRLLPWRTVEENVPLGAEFRREEPSVYKRVSRFFLEVVRLLVSQATTEAKRGC